MALRLRPHARRQMSKDQECGETTTQRVIHVRRQILEDPECGETTTQRVLHVRSQILKDREYGESTTQRVIVLRRRQKSMGSSQSFPGSTVPLRAISRWSDEDIRSRVSLHMIRINLGHPMPSFMHGVSRSPKERCTSHPHRKDECKKLFKIPIPEQQTSETGRGEKVIYVSIWKECFFADNIFDSAGKDIKHVRSICQNHIISQRARAFASYIPCFYVKIIVFLMLFIRCFFCQLSFPLAMYYRTYKHVKIHRSCDERGVRPVFTGSACHGPVIYGIRNFCCTFCRAQRQSDVSLKLLEIMNKERQGKVAR
ncbi:uncharacterized protein [Palaemon carinicauda]|uniref:uncharacterized protein n=1 Tax=Palaemon carinicauda TaxID=392227 RepID=UPI0035B5ED38